MEVGRILRRPRHAAILLVALGLGLGTFLFLSGDDPTVSRDGSERPTTSEASVLGVVITADDAATLPTAAPASPATVEPATPSTTQGAGPATTAPRAPTTTTSGPSLIEPTVIENTTTTTSPPTTVDLTTTTTAPTTTTEPPAG